MLFFICSVCVCVNILLKSLLLLLWPCIELNISPGQIKRMKGEQDIRMSHSGRWKVVFMTDNARCTAAQWWGTDRNLLILEILPKPLFSLVSVCVYLWSRHRIHTSIHLLPYCNLHLRHIGTQDGKVGREITLIYSLPVSLCGYAICFRSFKWVFSVFSFVWLALWKLWWYKVSIISVWMCLFFNWIVLLFTFVAAISFNFI